MDFVVMPYSPNDNITPNFCIGQDCPQLDCNKVCGDCSTLCGADCPTLRCVGDFPCPPRMYPPLSTK
ncbi:hypothetical protein KQI42_05520 [Tissierella sp. MSJ-40]|uniref:4Fe-4S ferredoxin-type domain-containing protein n=1 Tax=Tissierella simiarum TaxID=2841534 RepID=A0ABS6E3U3_9FIRM|nr:hypothetical protein [Tissierella simiarum]MBU5437457.1 hypothetical protein [Tissierella simiarum]